MTQCHDDTTDQVSLCQVAPDKLSHRPSVRRSFHREPGGEIFLKILLIPTATVTAKMTGEVPSKPGLPGVDSEYQSLKELACPACCPRRLFPASTFRFMVSSLTTVITH